MKCKSISIIEDEPSHALLLRYNLERIGHQVVNYASGEEFLSQLPSINPSLFIINVQLDKINGLKICEEIRKKGILTPILFLSTTRQEECSCIHHIDFLTKPFQILDLLKKVQQLTDLTSI